MSVRSRWTLTRQGGGEPLVPALTLTPREHQDRAAEIALSQGRVCLQVGTGGGKTLIGTEVIRRMNLPTLWLVHTKDLLRQVRRECGEMLGGYPIGGIGDGKVEIPEGSLPVVVGMVQTLTRLPKSLPFWRLPRLLIIDECQFASAETWYDVSMKCDNAIYRLGLERHGRDRRRGQRHEA